LRYENALLRIDNLDKASQLRDKFVHRSWARLLNGFARPMNPVLPAIKAAGFGGYCCVVDQAEIATDVIFKSRPDLMDMCPDLVHHAALNMSSEDVLGSWDASSTPLWWPRS